MTYTDDPGSEGRSVQSAQKLRPLVEREDFWSDTCQARFLRCSTQLRKRLSCIASLGVDSAPRGVSKSSTCYMLWTLRFQAGKRSTLNYFIKLSNSITRESVRRG